MNSYLCDPIVIADGACIETDVADLEPSDGDTEQLIEIYDLENDTVAIASEESMLPGPPTKPNVYIKDKTICPVCTQRGKLRQTSKENQFRIYIYIYIT